MVNKVKALTLLACGAIALMPIGAGAEVYKCMVEGRLVYSDRMCDAESTPLDTTQSLGGATERRHSYRRSDHSRRRAEELREEQYRKSARRGPAIIDRADPETVARCDALKKLKARVERSGGPVSMEDAEKLEELEFSNCYGHVNGNQ